MRPSSITIPVIFLCFVDPRLPELKIRFFDRLKDVIENLPFTYNLRIELPSFPRLGNVSLSITDDIVLTQGAFSFQPPSSTPSEGLGRALLGNTISTYFEIRTSGYATESTDSAPLANALSISKRCAFILTTFGSFFHKFTAYRARSFLIRQNSNSEIHIELPSSLSRCFGSLTPNLAKLKRTVISKDGPNTSLLGSVKEVAVETTDEKWSAIHDQLKQISRFFAKRSHPDFDSISAAIEWYQDSIYADNQTFAYLAACIGLEALIGSEDPMDEMTKRLCDRYGFLMGQSRTQREQLGKQYQEVLKIRGKLVHAKAARLSGDNHKFLSIAQKMLLDAIWKELHRIYGDNMQEATG